MENKNSIDHRASRGIGRAIALNLAKEGYNIAINHNGNAEKAAAVKEECEAWRIRAMICQCNVGKITQRSKAMVDQVVAEFNHRRAGQQCRYYR